jgi:hypothetical protein
MTGCLRRFLIRLMNRLVIACYRTPDGHRCLRCGRKVEVMNGWLDPWHLYVTCPKSVPIEPLAQEYLRQLGFAPTGEGRG